MKTTALIIVAGIAAAASAQTMTIYWTEITASGDNIIDPGQGESSIELTLWADMDPGATGFAGSIYEILGTNNWDTGTLDLYENQLKALTDDGTLQANNDILDIESFQLPPFFNPDFIADNPIMLYKINWATNDFTTRTVDFDSKNHANFSVYTDDFGTSAEYTGDVLPGQFFIVPAPASTALIGLGGLVATRRRR